ncbi:Protein tyrosine kinase/Protein kinase domain containing protein, putative [Leishmania lindenbergi]|uniref:Protein kinase domain-containing protein n=1 Tax=Leishmania lindenbergi TaxID=651832 RepID=A0AAW3A729_9TRYP
MVLKRMDNASVEDGLQVATLREIMVLDEVSAGTANRDRAERDAFRCGRAVFRPTMAAPCKTQGLESCHSSFMDQSRCCSGGAAEDEWDDAISCSSSPQRNGAFDALSAQRRRRICRGRRHLIGIRDAILRPHEQLAYVAMDYCEGGDLWHFMRGLKTSVRCVSGKFGDVMSTQVFRRWAVELILALGFLHSHNIAHRDLKPQNLMLAKRTDITMPSSSSAIDRANGYESHHMEDAPAGELYTLKVGDFGLSRLEGIPYKKYVHEAVTLWYRSPDVLLGNTNYTYSADTWSLGCILIEMASGSVLFKGKDEADELRHIFTRGCRPTPLTFPRMREYHYCERYAEVLSRYEEADPDNVTMEELMQMQVERLSRHLRAFLRDRHSLELLGDAGVDLVARLLILDPERRLTIMEAMNHRFFTAAYAEVYGVD